MVKITGFETHGSFPLRQLLALFISADGSSDVRFPTSLTGDGTDAMYAYFYRDA